MHLPETLNSNIKQALNTVNEANLSKDELESQHKRKEFISIQKLALMKAKHDGIEQGIEQGIEKEKLNIAKNSINQGLDNKTIAMITGLQIDTIEKLKLK